MLAGSLLRHCPIDLSLSFNHPTDTLSSLLQVPHVSILRVNGFVVGPLRHLFSSPFVHSLTELHIAAFIFVGAGVAEVLTKNAPQLRTVAIHHEVGMTVDVSFALMALSQITELRLEEEFSILFINVCWLELEWRCHIITTLESAQLLSDRETLRIIQTAMPFVDMTLNQWETMIQIYMPHLRTLVLRLRREHDASVLKEISIQLAAIRENLQHPCEEVKQLDVFAEGCVAGSSAT